jgi:predicted signal transduction protein with EAL and GGDEF domain
MIVDDEPINIDVVQAFLEEENYRNFVTVDDSMQAMRLLEETHPDLLLLDLMMPEVSGFDILSAVRAHPKFKYIPVIILTASTETQNKLKALDLGATDFLGKPLDQSELGLRVRNTLAAKAYQDQLAYYDALTKLPNRHLFLEDLSWALNTAKRHEEQLALLSIEIDNFDKVNDTIGFSAGDEVLRLVAHRIQKVIREVDVLGRSAAAADDEGARMALFHLDSGGFSLLINRIPAADQAAVIAKHIIKELRTPMRIGGDDIYVTASIGIATTPPESDESSELLRLASSAKDYAKKLGGNSFQFSSSAINTMYEKRLRLETRLRKALKKKEFVLYYQPKVEIKTGVVKGVEALLRWESDEGLVSPGDFIPLTEETGLIVPIGEWALSEACRQLNLWHQSARIPLSMAVNISARQFSDANFLSTVKRIIGSSGIDTRFLTLELTESLLLGNIDDKIKLMKNLKAMGLKLSLDDFGTGYSSLNYLRKLPLDELKIDRSFIREVSENTDSRAIVSTIVFLAQSLKLSIVAEGIEKKEELEFLRTLGCHQYQGFFFSRPVPSNELCQLLSLKC